MLHYCHKPGKQSSMYSHTHTPETIEHMIRKQHTYTQVFVDQGPEARQTRFIIVHQPPSGE